MVGNRLCRARSRVETPARNKIEKRTLVNIELCIPREGKSGETRRGKKKKGNVSSDLVLSLSLCDYLLSRRCSGCVIGGSLLGGNVISGLGLSVQSLGRDQVVFPHPQIFRFALPLLPRVPLPRLPLPLLPLPLLLLSDSDRMRDRCTCPRMMMAHMRRHPGMRRRVRSASWRRQRQERVPRHRGRLHVSLRSIRHLLQ